MTMPTAPRCPACNADLEPDDRFCAKCGAPVPATPAPRPDDKAPASTGGAAAAAPDGKLEAALKEALAPRYQLVRQLGTGGMGSVYLAREPALKRLVAVKALSPALAVDATARARFQREAQAVAGISHPNVVSIYAVGELADGTPYFVMQHVSGESLASRLEREGPVTPAEARRMLGQTASALAAAHAKGIIHRDIKPANVLYDEESGRVLVTDFGIAAVLPASEAEAPSHLTGTGMAIGTPQYMSPEQLLAEKVTDRTDIYSLGLLAYELLTGAGPFSISSPREIVAAHLRDTPRPLSQLKPDVDHELESIITACLRKEPQQRPAAAELAQRLGAADSVLEWPPPGLDALLGRAGHLTRDFALASTLFAGPLLVMLGLGSGLAAAAVEVLRVVLAAASAIGGILLVLAARRALLLGTEVTRAVRSGYAWRTVAEVLADSRGDTGALIAGTREYSALTAEARDRFRGARVAAALGRAAGAVVAGPVLVLALVLGPHGDAGAPSVAAMVLLPIVALMLVGVWLSAPELRAVRAARVRLRRPPQAGATGQFVIAWYESFEAARRGQALGRGDPGKAGLGRAAAFALALAVVSGACLALPILIAVVAGPPYYRNAHFSLGDTPARAARQMARLLELSDIARPYRLPADPAITPLAAGRALVVLNGRPRSSAFRLLPGADAAPPDWLPPDSGLFDFAAVVVQGRKLPGSLLTQGDSLIAHAARGLTPGQRAYLERVAANPAITAVETLARASHLDQLGAFLSLPFPDSATWMDLPAADVALKTAGRANVARAALLLSQGKRPEAEIAIRESISLGLLLIDENANVVSAWLGGVIAGYGRHALLSFYEVTGRAAEARSLRATSDSVVNHYLTAPEIPETAVPDVPSMRRFLVRRVTDPSVNRALRWESLRNLMYTECSNIGEILFGPDVDVRVAAEAAKPQMARYPSEAALFALIQAAPERFPARRLMSGLPSTLFGAARLSGALLRNDRIAGCLGPVIEDAFPAD